jgi:hypothetical protein
MAGALQFFGRSIIIEAVVDSCLKAKDARCAITFCRARHVLHRRLSQSDPVLVRDDRLQRACAAGRSDGVAVPGAVPGFDP